MTWLEVEDRLTAGACVMLPLGSTEQHGPMGLIGTDAICAENVAFAAAEIADAIVAPTLAYTPAYFNTSFAGTISLPEEVFEACLTEICTGLLTQGFRGIFVMNGHGANLAPAKTVAARMPKGCMSIQSWWDPPEVAQMRQDMFGAWEGMHATPSEIAITQTLFGAKPVGSAADPPLRLSTKYIQEHSGDKHGPPDQHRADFPDGRVGSHSALATPQAGAELLEVASQSLALRYQQFCQQRGAKS